MSDCGNIVSNQIMQNWHLSAFTKEDLRAFLGTYTRSVFNDLRVCTNQRDLTEAAVLCGLRYSAMTAIKRLWQFITGEAFQVYSFERALRYCT